MSRLRIVVVTVALLLAGCAARDSKQTERVDPAKGAEQRAADLSKPAGDAGETVIPADSPKLRQIRVEPAETAQVPMDELGSPGKVEANPNRMAHVLLPVAGRISRVYVKMGDSARQGQALLSVESPDVDAAISTYLQNNATVTQARAALAKSQADLDRARDLFEHNAVAKKELLNAEAMLTQNQAAVDQAIASQQQALRRLEILGVKPGQFGQQVDVRAPVSGKVLEINVVPGEYRNDASSPVMRIADLSTVWVTSDVPETSIRFVKPGEPVEIELSAYPGEVFRGRVTQIADIVDPQTRTVKVRAELANPDGRLRPEMFARIQLVGRVQPKPVVPVSAVMQSDAGTFVLRRVAPGRFQKANVTLGSRIGDRVAINEGIKPGDEIVTDGAMLVRN